MFAIVVGLVAGCATPIAVARSNDGKLAIDLPPHWQTAAADSPLRTSAPASDQKIFARAADGQSAAAASEAPKSETAVKTLEEYVELIEQHGDLRAAPDQTKDGPRETRIGDRRVLVVEVHATNDGFHVVYLRHYFETPTAWVQLICWSQLSDRDATAADCDAMVQSFRETPRR